MTTKSHLGSRRVSSTWVRESLKVGNLAQAKELLNRDYNMIGRVAHGDKRARDWGIPTANVRLKRKSVPVTGVYCVRIRLKTKLYAGVANVGKRPTVDGGVTLLEVHLFDFEDDIYGQLIEVYFIKKLRDEEKFFFYRQFKKTNFKGCPSGKKLFFYTD